MTNLVNSVQTNVIDSVCSIFGDKVLELLNQKEWENLFVKSGSFFIESEEFSRNVKEDLVRLFSKENMKLLAKEMRNTSAFRFTKELHVRLQKLMAKYEIDYNISEAYVSNFITSIITEIEKNNPIQSIQILLNDMRGFVRKEYEDFMRELSYIKNLVEELKDDEISIETIDEIDYDLRKKTQRPSIGLDFFSVDDEEFIDTLTTRLDDEIIHIVGPSVEETLYCVLNTLKEMNLTRRILVVKNEKSWKQLENKKQSGCILIPYFDCKSKSAIPNNTNIFIWNYNQQCNSQKKLRLRKRTINTISSNLQKAGLSCAESYKLVEKTNGLFTPLMMRIFKGAIIETWDFSRCNMNVILTALLCGKWTESIGDKHFIEELSGMSYESFFVEIASLKKGSYPFVIETFTQREVVHQLSHVEAAWECLNYNISQEKWNTFLDKVYEVFIKTDLFSTNVMESHNPKVVCLKGNTISDILKKGIIRTLTIRACCINDCKNQNDADYIVKKILECVVTKEQWSYISVYLLDLCEASPNSMMNRLEEEIRKPSGMIELFKTQSDNVLFDCNHYTFVLRVLEQLLLYKNFASRAINLLWKINELNIDYKIDDCPKVILCNIFCVWFNISALTVDEKIEKALYALDKYECAWDIICDSLSSIDRSIVVPRIQPIYRSSVEIQPVNEVNKNNICLEFLNGCINKCDTSGKRWIKIIRSLPYFSTVIIQQTLIVLQNTIVNMNDENRNLIKNELRKIIYYHRYYSEEEWTMDESSILLFEACFHSIKLENQIYGYLYLFEKSCEFPLLNPVPYHEEIRTEDDVNSRKREEEIKLKIKEFKDLNLNLYDLLKLIDDKEKCNIGKYIAKYFDEDKYNQCTLDLLLEFNSGENIIFDYIFHFVQQNAIDLESVISYIKTKSTNTNFIVQLISLTSIDQCENSMIGLETDDVKQAYWSRQLIHVPDDNKAVYLWAINECLNYGSIESLFCILYDLKEVLTPMEIFRIFMHLESSFNLKKDKEVSLHSFHIQAIFKILQDAYLNDDEIYALVWAYFSAILQDAYLNYDEMCKRVAQFEIMFMKILKWENMRCTCAIMKKSPTLYALLIAKVFKKDNEKIVASKYNVDLYHLYYNAHFCPTENNGIVDYNGLKQWVNRFEELLEQENLGHLTMMILGKLFAYSPQGKDGYMPCEAIRDMIEDLHNEEIVKGYIMAEFNKRGVYVANAGKSEKQLAESYKLNADSIRNIYPYTASIFDRLSQQYTSYSIDDRRMAEDEV